MAISASDVFRKSMTAAQRQAAAHRADELAAEYFTLQQLRKARELTQVQLGALLGKNQVAIAQLERRTDMLLSTLRSYVEAMGGSLSLVVQFPDRDPVYLAGVAAEASASPVRRRRARGTRNSTVSS
ncbi:MAG: helix-turn-helix domain-containing protein [Alphaproteobacteria bacterium]